MTASKKEKKQKEKSHSLITNIKELFTFNIGTIIFGAIFLYMMISIVLYLTADHISTYQVTAGPLAKNQTYTGIILRSEEVVTADTSGYLTYYAPENSKVRKNGVVYSIGESQSQSRTIELTDSALQKLRIQMSSFSTNFDTNDYNRLYSFKHEIEGTLLQNSGVIAPAATENGANATVGGQTICYSSSDGLILYSMDGYETLDASSVTADKINTKSYRVQNLKTKERISAGDPVYKIITDENWSLFLPLTDKQVIQLGERSTIRVKFLKDGVTQTADVLIHTQDDGSYLLELKFRSGVIRYANDRFLQIELVTNTESGLKIPIRSIVNKEFFTIPDTYATKGGGSSELGFLKETTNSDGETITEFSIVTLYEHKNGLYYVDKSDFSPGDSIIKSDSGERYVIGDTAALEGVYCINKGYAVFRKVVIIDKNEEYCIVETGTSYGISQYDFIVEDSSKVKEETILY